MRLAWNRVDGSKGFINICMDQNQDKQEAKYLEFPKYLEILLWCEIMHVYISWMDNQGWDYLWLEPKRRRRRTMWLHSSCLRGSGQYNRGSLSSFILSVYPKTGLTNQTHKGLFLKPNIYLHILRVTEILIYPFYLTKGYTHLPSYQVSESLYFTTPPQHSVVIILKVFNNWQVKNGFHLSKFPWIQGQLSKQDRDGFDSFHGTLFPTKSGSMPHPSR